MRMRPPAADVVLQLVQLSADQHVDAAEDERRAHDRRVQRGVEVLQDGARVVLPGTKKDGVLQPSQDPLVVDRQKSAF